MQLEGKHDAMFESETVKLYGETKGGMWWIIEVGEGWIFKYVWRLLAKPSLTLENDYGPLSSAAFETRCTLGSWQ